MTQQLSLFACENRTVSHLAGFTVMIRAAMNRAAAASPYSREQIVDRMNHLSGMAGKRLTQGKATRISLETLEKWLNPESDNIPSLLAVEVFMWAVGSTLPLEAWTQNHGCELMTPEARVYCDMGRALEGKQRAAEQFRNAQQRLKEVRK